MVPDFVADPKTAANTREFGNLMSMEAIKSMSATLKGATTDREMARFTEILGDPKTPPDLRERTLDRMITLAQRQKDLAETRVNDLRGGDYYKPKPKGEATAKPGERTAIPDGMSAAQAVAQAKDAVKAGRDPAVVRGMLQSWGIDPKRLD